MIPGAAAFAVVGRRGRRDEKRAGGGEASNPPRRAEADHATDYPSLHNKALARPAEYEHSTYIFNSTESDEANVNENIQVNVETFWRRDALRAV